MKLVKGTSTYTFPNYSGLNKNKSSIRCDEVDKAFSHGSIMTGDGQVESRSIEVEVPLTGGTTRAAYRDALDALTAAAYRADQRLYVDDTRYINVASLKGIEEEWYDGFYLVRATVTLTFLCTDPFFYSTTTTAQEVEITESPQTIVVANAGNMDTPPIITIEPAETAAFTSLVNSTDNDRTFSYSDVAFVSGNALVIDSEDGTVEKEGVNTLNNMGGTFLRLLAGNNSIIYTGALGTITFSHVNRWL